MVILEPVLRFIRDTVSLVIGWLHALRYDLYAPRIEASGLGSKRIELVNQLPHSSRVLEVGAGTGATTMTGAYDGADRFSRVVLCEPDDALRSRMSRKLAKRRAQGAREPKGGFEVVRAALPDLPCADAEFDAVVLFMVASHLHPRTACLKELLRVLIPGGTLVFIDHVAEPENENDNGKGSHYSRHRHHHHHHHHNHHQSGKDNDSFSLSWFLESLRFQRKIKAHEHDHTNSDLSFQPLIDSFTTAGFERVSVETFKTVNSGMSFLDELISGTWRKPIQDSGQAGSRSVIASFSESEKKAH